MSKQRMINTSFWSDPWVVDTLNPLDAHLFLYLMTNEHTTIAGVYEISLRTIANEIGIEKEEVGRMLRRLEPKVKYMDGWIVLRNGLRNQNYTSPKIKTGIQMVLERCPAELMDYIDWPKDFGIEKPKGSTQQQLIMEDLSGFDNAKSVDLKSTVDKKSVVSKSTPQGVIDGMHRVSHSNTKAVGNSKPTVGLRASKTASPKIATTGSKYFEIDLLYEDLNDLVNDKFKAWYCQVFYKLGRDKVLRLASEARADGKDPVKLFSHLLAKESGIKHAAQKS